MFKIYENPSNITKLDFQHGFDLKDRNDLYRFLKLSLSD